MYLHSQYTSGKFEGLSGFCKVTLIFKKCNKCHNCHMNMVSSNKCFRTSLIDAWGHLDQEWLIFPWLTHYSFFIFNFFPFLKFYCCSSTVVCFSPHLSSPPQPSTPQSPDSTPSWFCPCVLYSFSGKPFTLSSLELESDCYKSSVIPENIQTLRHEKRLLISKLGRVSVNEERYIGKILSIM